MNKREFISLLGGAAAAWPVATRAQQVEQVRRIGMLFGQTLNDPAVLPRIEAFRQALQQLGWSMDVHPGWFSDNKEWIEYIAAVVVLWLLAMAAVSVFDLRSAG